MSKAKMLKIAIPAGICVIALIILAVVLTSGNDSRTWRDYYDLGMQYLEEGNYEEAIVAFTSAIELDDSQSIVYVGRGDAYAGMAREAEERGDFEEAEELYANAAEDYEQAVQLGDEEDAADKLERIQAAMERVAEQIAAAENSDLTEEETELTEQPADTDQADTEAENTASDRNTQSSTTGNTNRGNTNTSGNTTNSNTGNRNNGNSGTNTGTVNPAPSTSTGETSSSDLQANVLSYMDTFFDKTTDDVIRDFGSDYEIRAAGENAAGNATEELYYENEGIGFEYNGTEIYDFVIYSDEIDIGYGLRGGMTYDELKNSFIGEIYPPENFYETNTWYTNCFLEGDPDTGEGFLESWYEWQGDPYTTAGELHLGGVRV